MCGLVAYFIQANQNAIAESAVVTCIVPWVWRYIDQCVGWCRSRCGRRRSRCACGGIENREMVYFKLCYGQLIQILGKHHHPFRHTHTPESICRHTAAWIEVSITTHNRECCAIAACDEHCTSGCNSQGGGMCDSGCETGYSLNTADYTCMGQIFVYSATLAPSRAFGALCLHYTPPTPSSRRCYVADVTAAVTSA